MEYRFSDLFDRADLRPILASSSLARVKQAPVVTEEQAQGYLHFLIQALQHRAEQGLSLLHFREALSVSKEREARLQRAYQELESRISDRTEQLQKTNQALQESEQCFRVALIDTPIVVFNQDVDLRYTWVYNLQGYTDRSIIGETDADLYSPEDAERLTALKRRVMAAGQSGGSGLQGMKERVERLGGSLEIESAPMQGTGLRARVPVQGTGSGQAKRRLR